LNYEDSHHATYYKTQDGALKETITPEHPERLEIVEQISIEIIERTPKGDLIPKTLYHELEKRALEHSKSKKHNGLIRIKRRNQEELGSGVYKLEGLVYLLKENSQN